MAEAGAPEQMASDPQVRHSRSGSLLTAVSWNTLSTVVSNGVQFVRSIFLARLLEKDVFGLFGMATIVLQGATVLTEFGLSSWVIAKDSRTDGDQRLVLDTMWSVEILRRILMSAILLATVYPAVQYFGDERLFPVMLAISCAPLLLGFLNVGLVQSQKQMQFRPVSIHRQATDVLSSVCTVFVAWLYPSVWALVLSLLLGNLISVAVSYVVSPYRPRWRIDREAFRGSLHFGKHVFVIGLLTFVTTQFDNLIVGRYLGTEVLAVYLLAYRLANLPVDIFASIITSALFPAYSKIRSMNPEQLQSEFVRISGMTMGILLLIAGPLKFLAGPLITIPYGEKWAAATPLLAILVLQGLFRGLTRVMSPLLMGLLRPDLDAKAKIVEAVIFMPLTVLLVQRWSAAGAAWAGVITYFVAYVLRLAAVCHLWPHQRGWLLSRVTAPLWRAAVVFAIGEWLLGAGVSGWIVSIAYACTFAAITWVREPVQREAVRSIWRSVVNSAGR